MYLMPLKDTFKNSQNDKFYVMYILPQQQQKKENSNWLEYILILEC